MSCSALLIIPSNPSVSLTIFAVLSLDSSSVTIISNLSFTSDFTKDSIFFDINFSNNDEHQGEYVFNDKKEFVNTLKPIIQQELINQNINPYFADSLIAQLALESAWGSKPTGKNNFAGLKSKDGKSVNTKEYVNGKYVSIKDKFKNFESLEEFAKYYITKLKNKFKAFDGNDFVSNIRKHGYFTAPLNEYKRGFNLLLNNVRKLS